MNKDINTWTRKALLALPHRAWATSSEYASVLLVPTGRKHDSGWGVIAIVGVGPDGPLEIASSCSDDITWEIGPGAPGLRMDCARTARVMHAWANRAVFVVGAALSSVTVTVKRKP